MKTKILLFGLFLFSIFCFGQKKGETVTTEWLKHPCFNGIEYKVINYNYKNSDGEAYWGIIVRNGYGAPLSCSYSLKVGGVSWGSGYDNTYELAPGKSYSHSDGGLVTAMIFKSSSTNFTFEVKDVKVGNTKFACENGRQINLTQKEKNDTWQQNQYQTASELVERKNQLCVELGKLINGKSNNIYALCQAQTYGSGDVNKLKHEVKLLEDEIHKLKYEDSSNKGIANQTTTNSNNQQAEQQRQQQENQRIAEENARRAEEERQQKAQAKQELINISINATTDLINYFANRKNALRNSLDQEDAQALLAIVNSENPTNYTQNIIQIFTDLGYTYRETENKNGITTITMNNDVKNINDFLNIYITIPSYDNYNRISFSYHRKEKLLEQLAILGNKLEGYKRPEIKGVPPSRIEKVNTEIEKIEQETKNKEIQTIEVNQKIKDFEIIKYEKIKSEKITPELVISNHIQAIGGIQKLQELKFVTINEIYEESSNEYTTIRGFGKYSEIQKNDKGKILTKKVFDGENGYEIRYGDKNKLKKEEKEKLKQTVPIDIFDIQKLNLYVGDIVTFNGKNCYTLINEEKSYADSSFGVNTYFFDIETGLLVGKTRHLNSKPNDRWYNLYEDYANVDGILFYTKQISFDESDKNSTIIINGKIKNNSIIKKRSISLNQNISKTEFE